MNGRYALSTGVDAPAIYVVVNSLSSIDCLRDLQVDNQCSATSGYTVEYLSAQEWISYPDKLHIKMLSMDITDSSKINFLAKSSRRADRIELTRETFHQHV